MKAKPVVVLVVCASALVGLTASAVAECMPAPLAWPATEPQSCLVEFPLESFARNEEFTQTVALKKGQRYWFTASGCPRMGQIGIFVLTAQGKVVKQETGSKPAFCFTAPRDGDYMVQIKALSLRGGNTSGNIATCFAEAKCHKEQ